VVPAARRLRRLRWLMTVAFTLANLAGLVALAGVALKVDASSRSRAEYHETRSRISVASALVYVDNGELVLDWLTDDNVSVGHPEVYMVLGDVDHLTVAFAGRNRQHDVADTWLRTAAAQAMTAQADEVTVDARDSRGHRIYLLARPLYGDSDSKQLAGAVMAVGDPSEGAAEHRRLLWTLLAGVSVLALAAAAVGHTLSGRGVRPAIASLTQQERFLADAAHELRTPVAALRAAAEAALAETPAVEAVPPAAGASRVDLDSFVRHTQRLGSVVETLLTRARLAAGVQVAQPEPLRLDLLVEDVVAEVGGGTVALQTSPSVIQADPTLLRLAIRNLVENALRHGHQRGEPARIRVRVAGAVVVVADGGPGVPDELLKARFSRYTTGSATGTGLGLSIVAQVAAAHGGRLEVRNVPEGGALFTLILSR
jgi:signal transduction histidine kinase